MTGGDRLRVLGLSGSLRDASLNSGLLRAAVELAPQSMTVEIFSLRGVPLYDEDVEKRGDPGRVEELKAAIAGADALLIACPEYNFGITGVLKNALDWASRPPGKSALSGKPAAIVGATPGAGATRLAQMMARQALTALAVPILPTPLFMLGLAQEKFVDGALADPRSRELLGRVLVGLESFTERLSASL